MKNLSLKLPSEKLTTISAALKTIRKCPVSCCNHQLLIIKFSANNLKLNKQQYNNNVEYYATNKTLPGCLLTIL